MRNTSTVMPPEDDLPGDDALPTGGTVIGRAIYGQAEWWNDHPDALGEALALADWDELSVFGRTPVGPTIERPVQRLTMTVEEAAQALGLSRSFAYEAVNNGEIPSIRIGRRVLIPKVALDRLLEAAGEHGEPSHDC